MLDLHLHSHHSDGSRSPAELVKMAKERELRAIAVTDHDTVDGIAEALAEGQRQGVRVLSGVELSVSWRQYHFHLLGYDFQWQDEALQEGLSRLQVARSGRNRKIIEKLNSMGMAIGEDDLRRFNGNGQTGRPHIARLLVDRRVVPTIDQAFARYLRKGACAYVSRSILDAEEAFALIHGAGGITVLAHPAQIAAPPGELEGLVAALKDLGLDGMETFYPSQRGRVLRRMRELAHRFALLETGGSDYHGALRPSSAMAGGREFTVPGEVLDTLLQTLSENEARERINQR